MIRDSGAVSDRELTRSVMSTLTMSSELILLCQEQVALLENTLGASPVVVYIAETFLGGNDHNLVPAIARPDHRVAWDDICIHDDRQHGAEIQLRSAEPNRQRRPRDRPETVILSASGQAHPPLPPAPSPPDAKPNSNADLPLDDSEDNEDRDETYQLVMPLMHDNIAVGLLVTARANPPWSDSDRHFVEQIAHTIALACLMEQRQHWTNRRHRQQHHRQRQQHDLLHNWLHQFRNPLTALQIFGKLLIKQLPSDDPRRSHADNILRESHRLQDLFQDFRGAIDTDPFVLPQSTDIDDISSEAPTEPPPSQPFPLLPGSHDPTRPLDLADVLDPLLQSAAAIADDRQLQLNWTLADPLPPVLGHRRAVTEAAGNLIDNALKYTPTGGQIRIDVRPSHQDGLGAGVAMTISDTGVGIPPEDQANLFQRRFRGIQAQGEIPGTGLGLAIARDLVRQMQGDIWVISPANHPDDDFPGDRGTTLVLWLPQASASISTDAAPNS
ncbi:MAG: GAF domain-containing sensor histidine kinase [Phormidium sp. SL48-SHIP]|nr:MAG: GAF domain-containing sensor histidine kinase [Phormidium sp. SL48-SHIP]